jgi:WS/DGAT/MGAT family acyltransferase
MKKLSGGDAMFLYNETINTAQHVGFIQHLDVPADKLAGFFEAFKALYLERIHLLPYLTQRLQVMPWDIDHPVWVRHTRFNIDEHIFRVALDVPGTVEQLEALASKLYEPLLDRSRPLWACWVVEGLQGGHVAVIQKIHHACIDGMASVAALEVLNDTTPTPRRVEPAPPGFWDESDVSAPNLLRATWENLARYAFDEWTHGRARFAARTRAFQRMAQNVGDRPPWVAAKAPWNASIDARRSVAGVVMSLAKLKAIAKAAGVTINDVVLCITAEALNRYVERGGQRFAGAMIAGCPVSLRKPGDTRMNNQVTMMSVSLANEEDPVERLRAISRSSKSAKQLLAELGDTVQTDFGGAFVPVQLSRLAQEQRDGSAADAATWTLMNVVVSNVPGVKMPLYSAGAAIVGITPMSIVSHGGGLNVTVMSYCDRMDLGLTAAAKVIPDLPKMRDDFRAAYASLDVVLGSQSATAV